MERDIIALGAQLDDDQFANELYCACCNVIWVHEDNSTWTCSWRYAGGMVADLRNERKGPISTQSYEDYLDYYCMGKEGVVSDRVLEALATLGWRPERPGEAA
jgi:hypothetical protein